MFKLNILLNVSVLVDAMLLVILIALPSIYVRMYVHTVFHHRLRHTVINSSQTSYHFHHQLYMFMTETTFRHNPKYINEFDSYIIHSFIHI